MDDDESVRGSLARALSQEGYLVLPAADGQQALAIASATEIDLVLLDLKLPGKDGWTVFERLTIEDPLLPVIIITGRPSQLFPALAAGVGVLVEKPLDLPKLFQSMRNLLEEPGEMRLARIAGQPAEFHYFPSHQVSKRWFQPHSPLSNSWDR